MFPKVLQILSNKQCITCVKKPWRTGNEMLKVYIIFLFIIAL